MLQVQVLNGLSLLKCFLFLKLKLWMSYYLKTWENSEFSGKSPTKTDFITSAAWSTSRNSFTRPLANI